MGSWVWHPWEGGARPWTQTKPRTNISLSPFLPPSQNLELLLLSNEQNMEMSGTLFYWLWKQFNGSQHVKGSLPSIFRGGMKGRSTKCHGGPGHLIVVL